jgi:UDP-2,3-diacylglucosamine pyrophosphatase LpxH
VLFDDRRQGAAIVALCDRILREGGELVLLGDTFDFTSMNPPPRGVDRFYRKMQMKRAPPQHRRLDELCAAALRSNPVALGALARLSERAPVVVVPGNHDRHLADEGAQEALALVGLRAQIAQSVVRTLAGRTVVLQHGHEHDRGNAEPFGPGEVMTGALHHAVIPFLQEHGPRPWVRMDPSRVVALRREEAVISVLERWLEEKTFHRFFRALLSLLAANGYLPTGARVLTPLISVNRVRRAVEKQDRLWEATGFTARYAVQGKKRLPHGAPRPDVLVFGHTHVLDWSVVERHGADGLYVNLGTWTDRCFDASSPPDRTLPVLELRDDDGSLDVSLADLASDGRELQRFLSR